MNEWPMVSLGDHVDLLTGHPFRSEDYTNNPDDIRLISGYNIMQGYLRWDITNRWPVSKSSGLERYRLQASDVVLAMDRPWVDAGLKYAWMKQDDLPCLLVQRTARLRGGETLDVGFLRHLIGGPQFTSYAKRITTGTAVPHISPTNINSFRFLLPSLPEQEDIAAILDTWDDAITLTQQRIVAARQRKKGLMQGLLNGRMRFPEFAGEEWREAELGEFFREFTKRNKSNEDLTVLSCSTIHGIVPQAQVFSRRIASEDTERYKVVERGDLIYDPMLLWDASIGFLEVVELGVVSPAYSTFKFREENGVREYFRHLIKTHYLREQYKFISQGTNVRRRKAPVGAFLHLKVKVPGIKEEQEEIAAVLQTCDHEIELLTQKRDALQRQKKGLMQRLLTGRVRV